MLPKQNHSKHGRFKQRKRGSSLNISDPIEKAKIAKSETLESLKYEIMLNTTKTSGWTVEACKKHGMEMKELLSNYKNSQS